MDDCKLKLKAIVLSAKKNTKSIQYSVLATLATLIAINYLLQINFLVVLLYRLIELFVLISNVFIIYSWLAILYGKYLDETANFVIFVSCVSIEFLTQFIVHNLNLSNSGSNYNENDYYDYNQNYINSILIILVNLLISIYMKINLIVNLVIIALIILTRLYAQLFYINYLPQTVNVLFTYICAFCGILFTKHLESQLGVSSNENKSMNYLLSNKLKHVNCNGNGVMTTTIAKEAEEESNYNLKSNNKSNNNNCNMLTTTSTSTPYSSSSSSSLSNSLCNHNTKNNKATSTTTTSISKLNNNNNNNNKEENQNCTGNMKANVKQRRKLSLSSFSSVLPKRRTSLPIIPVKTDKNSICENTFIQEVFGIIDDMLNDMTLQPNITGGLKAIQQLLTRSLIYSNYNNIHSNNNYNNDSFNTSSSKDNNHGSNNMNGVTLPLKKNSLNFIEFENHGSDSAEESSPFMYNTDKIFKNRNRRSLPAHWGRRMSAITGSITTSATGMPIIESHPMRQRSCSLIGTPLNFNPNSFNANRALIQINYDKKQEQQEQQPSQQQLQQQQQQELQLDEPNNKELTKQSIITSDYESGESPTNSDYNSDTDKLHLTDHHAHLKKLEGIKEENSTTCSTPSSSSSTPINKLLASINNQSSKNHDIDGLDDIPWSINELENLDLINYIHDWSFPIFTFVERSNNFVLSKMAYKIFHDVGLFESFDIPIPQFIHFFHALECGYKDLPYHNRIHAADVLHACYYLTTQPIPYFVQSPLENTSNYNERPKLNRYHSSKCNFNNETFGCLGANFTPLELLALYCSAAMHDFDHPGRNNQFLVTTNAPLVMLVLSLATLALLVYPFKALLYNDRSVLENHHASSSWLLLKSNEKFNFLCNLDVAEWKRLRFLVLENILATDLNKHYPILGEFKDKIKPKIGLAPDRFDWKSESDRLLVSEIIIKLADISAPLKEKELHIQWTDRIMDEFYQQGDEETNAGLQISAYMDRNHPQVAKLQEHFIKNLVGSICNAYSEAGFLPGILIEDTDNEDSSDVEKKTSNENDPDFNCKNNKNEKRKPKIVYSEITSNFKTNYEMWVERAKLESQQLMN